MRKTNAKLTVSKVKKAIEGSHGIIAHIARKLGVARITVYDFLKKHPELKELVEHERESAIDLAESKLFQAVEAGEIYAVMYLLSTIGKRRGYSKREEIDHTTKGEAINEIKVKIVYANAKREKD